MTKDKPALPSKHIPRRTCVACRQTNAKRQLIRLVCLPGNEIKVDTTGKMSGRGAYLCSSTACWENAINAGKLEYALRTKIKPENKEILVNYAKGFNNTIS